MTLKELRDSKILEQQQIVDKAKAEHRDLTAEETARFDALQREIDDLNVKIREQEEQENRSAGAQEETPEQAAKRAIEAERTRTAEITDLCRTFGMDPTAYIRSGAGIDEVRKQIVAELAKTHAPVATGVSVERDENDKFIDAASDALLMSRSIPVDKPAAGADELRGATLRSIAAHTMRDVKGVEFMDAGSLFDAMVQRRDFANPVSVFPAILDATANKAYVQGYKTAATTYQLWATIGELPDFKESRSEYVPGSAAELELIPEGGEMTADTPKDYVRPKRHLETYGRRFAMSRQAFIDDDIGYITTLPMRYSKAAMETVNNKVYAALFANAKIAEDGKVLFGKDHGNLLTGAKPTYDSINDMILAMGMQTDLDGKPISNKLRYLIYPVGFGADVYSVLHSTSINTEGNTQAANPLYEMGRQIVPIEEQALNTMAGTKAVPWFGVADPTCSKSVEVDFLRGRRRPTMVREFDNKTLSYQWYIFLDFGVSVLDYRGIVENAGVAISNPGRA